MLTIMFFFDNMYMKMSNTEDLQISTPVFTTFKTINSYYLYDSSRNEIISISVEAFNLLQSIKDRAITLETAQANCPEINTLLKQGFLADCRVEILEHPFTDIVDTLLERRIQKMTLQLTQNCNFRCKYCHYTSNIGNQRTHSAKKCPLRLPKKAYSFCRTIL